MDEMLDGMIRELLELAATKTGDFWRGDDICIGSDEQVMRLARGIVQRHLCGATMTVAHQTFEECMAKPILVTR